MTQFQEILQEVFTDEIPMFALYLTVPILIEGFIARGLQRQKYPLSEAPATIFIGLIEVIVTAVSLYFLTGLMGSVEKHRLIHFERNWFYFLLLPVVCEFTFYYSHWMGHYCRWFWNEHQVHHSSAEMNLYVGNRNGWTFILAGPWIFSLPFVYLGFQWTDILAGLFIILHYQFFIHTTTVNKLGPLEYILNTPSLHRVHHGVQAQYLDKNFGGITIIFDYCFGTLQRELDEVPATYGLHNKEPQKNVFLIVFDGWISMFRDFATAPTWRQKMKTLVDMGRTPNPIPQEFKKTA